MLNASNVCCWAAIYSVLAFKVKQKCLMCAFHGAERSASILPITRVPQEMVP